LLHKKTAAGVTGNRSTFRLAKQHCGVLCGKLLAGVFAFGSTQNAQLKILKFPVLTEDIAGKQDARAPVSRCADIFDYYAATAGAVYAHNPAGGVFDDHGYVLNAAAPTTKKEQVARHHFAERNADPLQGLHARTGGNGGIEFFQNETGKARAIEPDFGVSAGVPVARAHKRLGVINDFVAQLEHFHAHGAARTEGAANQKN
jgi:hypothetical protein